MDEEDERSIDCSSQKKPRWLIRSDLTCIVLTRSTSRDSLLLFSNLSFRSIPTLTHSRLLSNLPRWDHQLADTAVYASIKASKQWTTSAL